LPADSLDISDAFAALGYLFLGDFEIPAPGPDACGPDPMPDGDVELTCDSYPPSLCDG
jgi:hypothetical protein